MPRLEDDFEVLGELGAGGMGRVVRVRDRRTNEEWAAKVLIGTDADSRMRFLREVKQMVRYGDLKLRHVMKIGRWRLDATPPYFLMPLARGGTLTKHIGRLSDGAILSVMRQLLETLSQIHADGGVHRDVKPDNILLPGDGTSALADFGVGNSPNCTVHFTLNGAGTHGYVAPEVLRNAPCTRESDVFSAGATWFHLLTGRHPGGLPVPLDPRAYKPAVPDHIAQLVLQMTHPTPWQRPSTAAVLRSLQAQLPTGDLPLPTSPPSNAGKWAVGVGVVGLVAFALSRK